MGRKEGWKGERDGGGIVEGRDGGGEGGRKGQDGGGGMGEREGRKREK